MASDNGVEEGGVCLRSSSPLRSQGVPVPGDRTLQTFQPDYKPGVSLCCQCKYQEQTLQTDKEAGRGRGWALHCA